MTDDTTTQTDGKSQTAGSDGADQAKEETYTKIQLTDLISKEVGKVVAKHSKKYDDLKAELEAEKRKALPDPEKIKAELADKDKAITDRDKELFGIKLENAKLRALMKAGVDPAKADSLLKRVVGNTPEEIEADVAELQTLGLLQSKTPGEAQGAGNPGLQKKEEPPNIDTQIATAHAEALKNGNWNLYNSLILQKQGQKIG
jgi:hypothetical protein